MDTPFGAEKSPSLSWKDEILRGPPASEGRRSKVDVPLSSKGRQKETPAEFIPEMRRQGD
jgi:hypothetical protein